jgi:hypothetical protein
MAERAGVIETGVAGSVDLFHAAAVPRASDDLVRPEKGAGGKVMFDPSRLLECGGVFRTDDGGQSWVPTTLRNVFATSIAVDPSKPETVYAGARKPGPLYPDGGVFRSTDGGRTWERIGLGLPPSGVHQIVIEPSGTVIHAGTLSGVYDYEIVPGARPPVIPDRSRTTRVLPGRP